ncbi:twin-arginine translocase TatA/TatE family subunit [candidate division WOR-3 bacterium]|nr:twin-arginine translocase TatA/TatE family subunit [candidate division WOR-3 bacterium]
MFGNIGLGEWLIILLVVLLLFGASRIPELMRSMGRGVREFKKGMKEIESDDDTDQKKDAKKDQD